MIYPATGISFAYLTNGYDRNDLREGRRGRRGMQPGGRLPRLGRHR